MAYRLDRDSLRPLLRKAAREAKIHREVCGLLIDVGASIRLVEIRNTSRRPGSFVLHRRDWVAAERAVRRLGLKVAGTFHSHVVSAPIPSRGDVSGAIPGDLMLIIHSSSARVRLWRIDGRARPVAHTIRR